MKDVLSVWMFRLKALWSNWGWELWIGFCIVGMLIPTLVYPLQILVITLGRAILSPIPKLAEWAVRSYMDYSDDMFLIACADCGRIFFLSCVISAFIEFLIAVIQAYTYSEEY